MTNRLLLAILLLAGAIAPGATAQGDKPERGVFEVALSSGVISIDGLKDAKPALGLTFRAPLLQRLCYAVDPTPPRCPVIIEVVVPIFWVPGPYPDPWPPNCPVCDFSIIGRPDVGPLYFVTPGLELTFRGREKLRPSVFFGVGLAHERGRDTTITVNRDGDTNPSSLAFRTANTSSPALTYGAAVTYALSSKTALRVEGRGFAFFANGMTASGPDGQAIEFQGRALASFGVTAGLNFTF